MTQTVRGAIRDRQQAKQLRDFTGLRYGKITPTDIDAFLDFGNKLFVFVEAKFGGAILPYGQRLALERVCSACVSESRYSYVVVARHDTPCGDDVDVATATVTGVYDGRRWQEPSVSCTVRQAVDHLRVRHGVDEQRGGSGNA